MQAAPHRLYAQLIRGLHVPSRSKLTEKSKSEYSFSLSAALMNSLKLHSLGRQPLRLSKDAGEEHGEWLAPHFSGPNAGYECRPPYPCHDLVCGRDSRTESRETRHRHPKPWEGRWTEVKGAQNTWLIKRVQRSLGMESWQINIVDIWRCWRHFCQTENIPEQDMLEAGTAWQWTVWAPALCPLAGTEECRFKIILVVPP